MEGSNSKSVEELEENFTTVKDSMRKIDYDLNKTIDVLRKDLTLLPKKYECNRDDCFYNFYILEDLSMLKNQRSKIFNYLFFHKKPTYLLSLDKKKIM